MAFVAGFFFSVLVVAASDTEEGRTLVSYVYYRPPVLEAPKQPWGKCAFFGRLCGCDTKIKMGSLATDEVEPTGHVTNCTRAPLCFCKGDGGRRAQYAQCTANLQFFVENAIPNADDKTDFIFSLVGATEAPDFLSAAAGAGQDRVRVQHVPQSPTDLCVQGSLLRKVLNDSDTYRQYKRFFLINCSSRGPYFGESHSWLHPFEQKLVGDVQLVGPVINCWQKQPHVQSWTWYFGLQGLQVVTDKCTCGGSRNDQIKACELGVSAHILANGGTIASLQPAYFSFDWRDPATHKCNKGKSPVGCSRTDPKDSLACLGSDPCQEVFVKYGGTNLALGFLPPALHERVHMLDSGNTKCS